VQKYYQKVQNFNHVGWVVHKCVTTLQTFVRHLKSIPFFLSTDFVLSATRCT